MNQVTSKLDLDGENPVGRPSPMFARSGREAEFQDALDRYLADYRRQQALYTRPSTPRLVARLPLQRRIADWLVRQLDAVPAVRAVRPH
jgi:hypothetical protein